MNPFQKFLDDKFSGLYPADLMTLPDPETSKVAVTALLLKLRKDLIPSPSPSVKIQIMGGKVYLR